jgi:hypothetical protein
VKPLLQLCGRSPAAVLRQVFGQPAAVLRQTISVFLTCLSLLVSNKNTPPGGMGEAAGERAHAPAFSAEGPSIPLMSRLIRLLPNPHYAV